MSTGLTPSRLNSVLNRLQHSEVSPFLPFRWSCLKSDEMARQLGLACYAFHKYGVFINSLATNAKAHVGPGPAWLGAGGAGGRQVLGPRLSLAPPWSNPLGC